MTPRRIVVHAPTLSSGHYCFESEQIGSFWKGRCLLTLGNTQFSGEAIMRTPERAIAAAMFAAAEAALAFDDFKPFQETNGDIIK